MKRYSQQFYSKNLIAAVIFIFVVISGGLQAVAAEVVVIPLIGNEKSSISPSDVLELGTAPISPNNKGELVEISPSASNLGLYTVPGGKYLVISSLTIFPQTPGPGNVGVTIVQNNKSRKYWVVPNSQPTHLSFGPGMLIAPGYSLYISNSSSSDGSIRVVLNGYETSQ